MSSLEFHLRQENVYSFFGRQWHFVRWGWGITSWDQGLVSLRPESYRLKIEKKSQRRPEPGEASPALGNWQGPGGPCRNIEIIFIDSKYNT